MERKQTFRIYLLRAPRLTCPTRYRFGQSSAVLKTVTCCKTLSWRSYKDNTKTTSPQEELSLPHRKYHGILHVLLLHNLLRSIILPQRLLTIYLDSVYQACVYVCMQTCMNASTRIYVRMYVCMYVCLYVCMYVCMYV